MMQNAQSTLNVRSLDSRELRLASEAQASQRSLSKVAGTLGFASEEEAVRAVATTLGLDFVDLSLADPDLSLLKQFPAKLIHRFGIFPLGRIDDALVVVTGNPFDLQSIDAVSAALGVSVTPVVALPWE